MTRLAPVAAGGALGALARYAALRRWPDLPGTFPWTALAINLVAAAALGLALALLDEERHAPRPVLRAFSVAGVIGGFGTLSLVAVQVVRLVDAGQGAIAARYLGAWLVGATAATLLGLWSGGWRPRHALPEEGEE